MSEHGQQPHGGLLGHSGCGGIVCFKCRCFDVKIDLAYIADIHEHILSYMRLK